MYETLKELFDRTKRATVISQTFPGWLDLQTPWDLEFEGDAYKFRGVYRLIAIQPGQNAFMHITLLDINQLKPRIGNIGRDIYQGFTEDPMWRDASLPAAVIAAKLQPSGVTTPFEKPLPPPGKFPTLGRECTCGAHSIGAMTHSHWCDRVRD